MRVGQRMILKEPFDPLPVRPLSTPDERGPVLLFYLHFTDGWTFIVPVSAIPSFSRTLSSPFPSSFEYPFLCLLVSLVCSSVPCLAPRLVILRLFVTTQNRYT